MMCYDCYLVLGYPIDTGFIEGACRSLIKDRADRSGSLWSAVGIQAVLNLRAVMKNGDCDDYWNYYMVSERKRLYGNLSSYDATNQSKAA